MLTVDPADRAKLIDPLFRTTRNFWLIAGILLALIAWGLWGYYGQLTKGLIVTGMNRPIFWGIYMVNFIFFIGISQAGTLISAVLRLTGAEWRRPITRVAEVITSIALIIASLQIIIDMGRPGPSAAGLSLRADAIPDSLGHHLPVSLFASFDDISVSATDP